MWLRATLFASKENRANIYFKACCEYYIIYFKLLISTKPVILNLNLDKNRFRNLAKAPVPSGVRTQKVWEESDNPHLLTNTSSNLFPELQRMYLEKHISHLIDVNSFSSPSRKLFLASIGIGFWNQTFPHQKLCQNFANDLKAPTLLLCQSLTLHCDYSADRSPRMATGPLCIHAVNESHWMPDVRQAHY